MVMEQINKMNRNPDQLCLLCQDRKAIATNSHWVPACMLKSMIGKRNVEESNLVSTEI